MIDIMQLELSFSSLSLSPPSLFLPPVIIAEQYQHNDTDNDTEAFSHLQPDDLNQTIFPPGSVYFSIPFELVSDRAQGMRTDMQFYSKDSSCIIYDVL